MYDVFFYEAFEEEADALKKFLPSSISYGMTWKTIQEESHSAPPARLISIRTQSILPPQWSTQLDGILSRSTGYDHLVNYRKQVSSPPHCGYLEEYATQAVAEHAILLTLALLRKLPLQWKQFPTFNRDGITGFECAGRKLLVVGVGRIGSEIARIGSALRMEVKGVDIEQKYSFVNYVERDEGIRWADIIVCAMNLTNENRGYFSYDLLKHVKKDTIFINIARGEHAPLKDIVRLLEEHHLGGAGLDVFEDEPNLASSLRGKADVNSESVATIKTLMEFPNVLLTPHNAFNTMEAVERKAQYSVQQIEYFLQHKKFLWEL
jgi:D-lactate dehydrogenase